MAMHVVLVPANPDKIRDYSQSMTKWPAAGNFAVYRQSFAAFFILEFLSKVATEVPFALNPSITGSHLSQVLSFSFWS